MLALCTGSQGEPRAAMARVAEDDHPDISLDKGDLVDFFLARHSRQREGGRQEFTTALRGSASTVVTDAEALVHVTGHPRREELRQMYAWLRPKIVVPMHGEARHLQEHAKLAAECGAAQTFVLTDGEMVELWPDPAGDHR